MLIIIDLDAVYTAALKVHTAIGELQINVIQLNYTLLTLQEAYDNLSTLCDGNVTCPFAMPVAPEVKNINEVSTASAFMIIVLLYLNMSIACGPFSSNRHAQQYRY